MSCSTTCYWQRVRTGTTRVAASWRLVPKGLSKLVDAAELCVVELSTLMGCVGQPDGEWKRPAAVTIFARKLRRGVAFKVQYVHLMGQAAKL